MSCTKPHQLPCRGGQNDCYNISQLCIYETDDFNHLIPCRTGVHLANSSLFQCNNHCKCPYSYCIPWSYVCNGRWDCPHGVDENQKNCVTKPTCSYMFQCKNSRQCIHLAQVCNNKKECPQHDDEKFCIESKLSCLQSCFCMLSAITCNQRNFSAPYLMKIYSFIAITLKQCKFDQFNINFQSSMRTKILTITSCDLEHFCGFFPKQNVLLHIDFSSNNVSFLKPICFQELKLLTFLDVAKNQISIIVPNTFVYNNNLQFVNLSRNPIISVGDNVFTNSTNIIYIAMVVNVSVKQTLDFHQSVFQELPHLKYFTTNKHKICCLLPENARCSVSVPWFQTCDNLLQFSLETFILHLIKCHLFVQSLIWSIASGFGQSKITDKSIKWYLGGIFKCDRCCTVITSLYAMGN